MASNSGNSSMANNSGYRSMASNSGDAGCAICSGSCGKAQAGKYGVIALQWWNEKGNRYEMRCAEIGCGDGSDGKLKAHICYRLDEAGEFIEIAD